MNWRSETCPLCGVSPEWHLTVRRAVVARNLEREKAGQPVSGEATTAWRLTYRHYHNFPCARFNAAFQFADLSEEEAA
jgi:hypothetical protein